MVHIGSSDAFVPGDFLCFESKTNPLNYHDEMNGDTFYKWFVKVLSLIEKNDNAMDNVLNHSVKRDPISNIP